MSGDIGIGNYPKYCDSIVSRGTCRYHAVFLLVFFSLISWNRWDSLTFSSPSGDHRGPGLLHFPAQVPAAGGGEELGAADQEALRPVEGLLQGWSCSRRELPPGPELLQGRTLKKKNRHRFRSRISVCSFTWSLSVPQAITTLVKNFKNSNITEVRLRVLLGYAEEDIYDQSRQATAFGLLKVALFFPLFNKRKKIYNIPPVFIKKNVSFF